MIETKVDGDAGGLESAANWIRSSLKDKVDSAAEDQVNARRAASRSWEGDSAEAYQEFSKPVLRATDEHVPRLGQAADAIEQLAHKLRAHEREMIAFRERARGGGLTVSGTTIQQPPDMPAATFEPGSEEESAHLAGVARVKLFNTLSDEVSTARENYATWVEAEMTDAVKKASDREDLDKVKDVVGKVLPGFLIGWNGLNFQDFGRRVRDERNRQRRRTKRSRNPDWSTRKPDQILSSKEFDELSKVIKFLDKWGKLAGPIGIGIDVLSGISDGVKTGDWARAVLTTTAAVGTGLAMGYLLGGATLGAMATAPIWGGVLIAGGTALATGVAAWGMSEGVGWAYDHKDEAADWVTGKAEEAGEWILDKRESSAEKVHDAWESVTPW